MDKLNKDIQRLSQDFIMEKKKQHRFIRLSKVRAYLLIKSIKRHLKEQERRAMLRP